MSDIVYLKPEELVARYRGEITEKTLSNWRGAGTGPPFTKIGFKVFYALKDVEAWEASRRTTRTPGRPAHARQAPLAPS